MRIIKRKILGEILIYFILRWIELIEFIYSIWFYIFISILVYLVSISTQYQEIIEYTKNDSFSLLILYLSLIFLFFIYWSKVLYKLPPMLQFFYKNFSNADAFKINEISDAFGNKIERKQVEISFSQKIEEYVDSAREKKGPFFHFFFNFLNHIEYYILFFFLSYPFYLYTSIFSNLWLYFFSVTISIIVCFYLMSFSKGINKLTGILIFLVFFIIAFFIHNSNKFMDGSTPFLLNLFLIIIILLYDIIRDYGILLILIIWVIICSGSNDNTKVKSLYIYRKTEFSIDEYLNKFIVNKNPSAGDTIPLILVSSEGGGVRSAAWTWFALREIKKENKFFDEFFFSFSGVSGGSVGGSLHIATMFDEIDDQSVTRVLSHDHLSKLIGSLLFRTPIQKILPFPIESLNRNSTLENSWALSLKKYTGSSAFDDYVCNLYENDTCFRPALFLNCTVAESGQKAIYSNLFLSEEDFPRMVILSNLLNNEEIKFKTAALLSARFPGVTSGGLISGRQGKIHVTDGGYIDNTGLQTSLQIILSLKTSMKYLERKYKIKIKPYLIFLKNSSPPKEKCCPESFKYFNETKQFFGSFLNSWQRSSDETQKLYSELLPKNDISFITISLHPCMMHRYYPLGWYISEEKVKSIKEEAKEKVESLWINNWSLTELYKEIDNFKMKKNVK